MSTPKNILLGLFVVTTVGGAALCWHQYKELVELRGAALVPDERAELQKKIWALQRENRELQDKLAAAESRPGESPAEVAAETPVPAAQARRGADATNGRWRGAFGGFQQVAATPEGQALLNSVGKAQMELRYAPLFKALNLAPDQADKLSALLQERQNALRDVFGAAREQGINPRSDPDAFNKLVADAQAPINDSIKALIGDSGVSQLDNFEQTMPQRNLVNLLQQRLNYTDAPLSSAQADQLVQILATTSPQRANPNNPRTAFGYGAMADGMTLAGPGAPKITSNAVAQAGTVLNSQQLTALQQLQQQQQDAQRLRDMMRNANRGGQPPAPAPAPKGGG